jgi:hypothetical protein
MANIETLYEMRRAGYKFLNHSKCKSCKAEIEWWETNNGKKLPFDPMPADDHAKVTAHFASCPNADDHRRPAPRAMQAFPKRLDLIRNLSDARVIIAVWADGSKSFTVRNGIDVEDLRQEVISTANWMRDDMQKGAAR